MSLDPEKEYEDYIGDGVYVSFDGYQIWLAANHPANKVVALEPEVLRALIDYSVRLRTQLMGDGA